MVRSITPLTAATTALPSSGTTPTAWPFLGVLATTKQRYPFRLPGYCLITNQSFPFPLAARGASPDRFLGLRENVSLLPHLLPGKPSLIITRLGRASFRENASVPFPLPAGKAQSQKPASGFCENLWLIFRCSRDSDSNGAKDNDLPGRPLWRTIVEAIKGSL
jgi:hypothetical protein